LLLLNIPQSALIKGKADKKLFTPARLRVAPFSLETIDVAMSLADISSGIGSRHITDLCSHLEKAVLM
jgi:hypothetical protein